MYTTNMNFYEETDEKETQSFTSSIAKNVFEAGDGFEALALHFHAGSEHTIDNQRFDLEMHIVMKNTIEDNEFLYSVIAVIFSVD